MNSEAESIKRTREQGGNTFSRINEAWLTSNSATQISVTPTVNNAIRDCLCRKSHKFLQSRRISFLRSASYWRGCSGAKSSLQGESVRMADFREQSSYVLRL
ncbi:MAG: hypothetical protein DME76_06775 [Verrucomicrobia bacterium]|nr:MAG: hypothetical protein DME76_06775 [Verrucomicrobiota bacterium]